MTELDEQTKLNIACCFYQMQQAFQETESERQRPHVLMRPKLFPDGDRWCALYGADLQEGVAGFGESPDKAMVAFDAAWYSKANTPVIHAEKQP